MTVEEKHAFFVDTTFDIVSSCGYKHTKEDIEEMVKQTNYRLHFRPLKHNNIHIGIWAIGQWFEGVEPNLLSNLSFADPIKDNTICVFVIHDWDIPSVFRPSLHTRQICLTYQDDYAESLELFKTELNYYLHNRISAFYDLVDFDEICLCHQNRNRYVAYFNAWVNSKIHHKTYKEVQEK